MTDMTDYLPPAACPRCGSSADVRTVRELFDMIHGMQDDAMQRHAMGGQSGFEPESPRPRSHHTDADPYEEPGEAIAGAVLSAAFGMVGRAIGKRVKRAFEDRVIPVMQEQQAKSRAEEEAIVARYPQLRGCLRDQVLFLEGGHRSMPISDLKWPATLAQADMIVAGLQD